MVEIRLPKLPNPVPPDGFAVSGYEVMYVGPCASMGRGTTLKEVSGKLESELFDTIRVYAICKGTTEENKADTMICEWGWRKSVWLEWEWM